MSNNRRSHETTFASFLLHIPKLRVTQHAHRTVLLAHCTQRRANESARFPHEHHAHVLRSSKNTRQRNYSASSDLVYVGRIQGAKALQTNDETRALLQKDINQVNVLEFAQEILSHNYTMSQLEIDDRWQKHYGDLVWDHTKFPDAFMFILNLSRVRANEITPNDKYFYRS